MPREERPPARNAGGPNRNPQDRARGALGRDVIWNDVTVVGGKRSNREGGASAAAARSAEQISFTHRKHDNT